MANAIPCTPCEIQSFVETNETLSNEITQSTSNVISRESWESHACLNSPQMEYVSFFSHIDPLWFPGDADNGDCELQLELASSGGIECS